ncbi:MAG: hypothetical protein QXL17_08220 [Candidatus Thermoplasmatota archaeon]
MEKIHNYLKKKKECAQVIRIVILLTFFVVLLVGSLFTNFVSASSFIPAPPDGPAVGFLDIEYTYTIYTTSSDADWMFDWGDGTYTPWLRVHDGENSIVQTHRWSSKGIYSVKVQFRNTYFKEGIWSNPLPVTISQSELSDFPYAPQIIIKNNNICEDSQILFITSAVDPKGDKVQIRFNWGDGMISEWSTLVDSGEYVSFQKIWNTSGTYHVTAQARDQYGLLSEWSTPLLVMVDVDTDQDMLSDTIEELVGSHSNDSTDVQTILIDHTMFFIVKTYEGLKKFYNPVLGKTTRIIENNSGVYFIDVDDNGVWDYQYTTRLGVVEDYVEQTQESRLEIPLLLIFIPGIVGGVLIVLAVLIKTGYIYLYEEYVLEE